MQQRKQGHYKNQTKIQMIEQFSNHSSNEKWMQIIISGYVVECGAKPKKPHTHTQKPYHFGFTTLPHSFDSHTHIDTYIHMPAKHKNKSLPFLQIPSVSSPVSV